MTIYRWAAAMPTMYSYPLGVSDNYHWTGLSLMSASNVRWGSSRREDEEWGGIGGWFVEQEMQRDTTLLPFISLLSVSPPIFMTLFFFNKDAFLCHSNPLSLSPSPSSQQWPKHPHMSIVWAPPEIIGKELSANYCAFFYSFKAPLVTRSQWC